VSIAPGTRLGSYEIVELLGAGGMGTVYRARDRRLSRDVAIKVLSDAVVHDRERLARFEREARLLAAINHPHIAGIHGIDEADGQQFLVMELVEGETLSDRLASGALPVGESLEIARQIAEALEAAHEKGIVHRDLKPSNVQIGRDGRVKLLDFGLAKALDPDPSASGVDSLSRSPTISHQMTGVGVILGTAAYMSPEQVRGRTVDRRSDIWAFGIVLYEMLAGRRLFTGETVSDTLASVLKTDPDWSLLPAETPAIVRRLLARCLERDPKQRLHDAGDARLDLEEALGELRGLSSPSVTGVVPPLARRRSISDRAPIAAAVALVLVAAAFAVGRWSGSGPSRDTSGSGSPIHAVVPLPAGERLAGWASPVVAISRDGRTVAYVSESDKDVQQLFVHRLDRGETRSVPGSENAEGPFFSPDGRWVAFAVEVSGRTAKPGELKKFSLETGLTQTIGPIGDFFGGDWGEDGEILFVNEVNGGIWKVPASGGKPERAIPTIRSNGRDEERGVNWPQRLPGGRAVLLSIDEGASSHVIALDLATREAKRLGIESYYARYLSSGHLVYIRDDGTLLAAPFDAGKREVTGAPVAILQDVAIANYGGVFAVSDDGTLVHATGYVRGSGRELMRLVRVGPGGSPEPLPLQADAFGRYPRISPDGRRIAVATWIGEIWIYDLARNSRVRLPRTKNVPWDYVVWAPDGERVAFAGYPAAGSGGQIFWQKTDGGSEAELLVSEGTFEKHPASFTPDGRTLAWAVGVGDERSAIRLQSIGQKDGTKIWASGNFDFPVVSPDGRWIAYEKYEGETIHVVLESFPEPGRRIQVTTTGGRRPVWTRDSTRVFYRDGDRFYFVRVEAGPSGPHVSAPELFAEVAGVRGFDVTPDGREIVAVWRPPDSGLQTQLKLATNWFAELERLAPKGSKK
jgi:serine/threonine protein kinase/Tol biopolymer transport system component